MKNTCPYCQSKKVIPILYGLPSPEGFEKADKGKVILGGCCPREENFHCVDCKKDFKGEVAQ